MNIWDVITGLPKHTSTAHSWQLARTASAGAAMIALACPAVAQDAAERVSVKPNTTAEEVEELANYEVTPENPQSMVVAQIGRSSMETTTDAEIADDVFEEESESLWTRLDQTPSEAVEGIPFGEYIAGDPEARRAAALRSGPLSTEQLNYYKDLARAMKDTNPEAAEAALDYYRTIEFELHQDYWVDTGDPSVPDTGNVLPVAAVVADEAVEKVTE